MFSFKDFLLERFLSIGFKPEHEEHREKHRQEIFDILQKSYSKVEGGYGGLGSGSEAEAKAIHGDISNLNIKATKRNGKITAVNLYKSQYGRKSVATGHDGSDQGKSDWKKIATEDITQTARHAWGETSGAVTHIRRKMGAKEVPYSITKKIVNKPDMEQIRDTNEYTRSIGGKKHHKVALGNPKRT
jgi:hypothetical protein